MESKLWLYPTIIAGVACIVVVAAYFFAFWVFDAVPRLRLVTSPEEALFLEGLVTLILGILILSPMPHIMYTSGGRGRISPGPQNPKDDVPPKSTKTNPPQLAIGVALITAAVTLIILSLTGP